MPKSLKLEDVMIKNVFTVGERAMMKTVVELMIKHYIGCLIVMRRKKPVGIVTMRDVLKRVLLSPKNTKKTKVNDMLMRKVGEIMTKPLITEKPRTGLREGVRLMTERKIKNLPIVENGHLLGLVTYTNIIRSKRYLEQIMSSFMSQVDFDHLFSAYAKKLRFQ
ncbi:MAG: CBS domain-containing protein [Candidatus Bathyarchaeota archaeon]|nr:MAG: CBS domain-containing protein [Candidatus Bathyarchaeota archaeon]